MDPRAGSARVGGPMSYVIRKAFDSVDLRTTLERARDLLADNLRDHPDPAAVAAILHFADTMRDHLRSRTGQVDYSAEALAYGRVATEIETAARMAKMPMPSPEVLAQIMTPAAPVPLIDPDLILDQMAQADADSAARRRDLARIINRKPRSAKWNRRRNKGR